MPGMILDATFLLDQVRDPGRGPQSGCIAQRLWTPLQRSRNALQLWGPESGLAARPPQTAVSLALQLPGPAAHRLPVHAHLAGHFRWAQALGQQPRRPPAPSFQGDKVSSYSGWISHAKRLAQMPEHVTILCETQ